MASEPALTGRDASRRRSKRPRGSTTSTRASVRPAATSPIRRSRRPSITRRPASEDQHRDRCRPVGILARVRRRDVRHRDSGVHGACVVQPEAVSPRLHGDVRGALHREPVVETNFGRQVLASYARQQRQPRDRDLGGGGSRGQARRYQVRARLGAESRAAASDGHRPGSDGADGNGKRLPGHRRRMHGRRIEFRGHRVSVHRRRSFAAAARCA